MKYPVLFRVMVAITALLFAGCATNLTKPTASPMPSKVRLGEFERVEIMAVAVNPEFWDDSASQRAVKKIDEHLKNKLRLIFHGAEFIEVVGSFSKSEKRTLQITPLVKEIKFVSGGTRFFAGAMAGSSAVLMQVEFSDSSTGEVIANPELYRTAGAFSGGWSIGGSDNAMLEEIAKAVAEYCMLNK